MSRISRIAESVVAGIGDEREKEMYLTIKEHLPVNVRVHKGSRGYILNIEPMTMTHHTWEHLHQNHRIPQDMDVSGMFYDYVNGEAGLRAGLREDVVKWFEFYKKFVKPANTF